MNGYLHSSESSLYCIETFLIFLSSSFGAVLTDLAAAVFRGLPQMAQSSYCRAIARGISGLRFLPAGVSGKASLDCQQVRPGFPLGRSGRNSLAGRCRRHAPPSVHGWNPNFRDQGMKRFPLQGGCSSSQMQILRHQRSAVLPPAPGKHGEGAGHAQASSERFWYRSNSRIARRAYRAIAGCR